VATVSAADGGPGTPAPIQVPVAGLLRAHDQTIPVWSLSDLGVPLDKIRRPEASLAFGPPRSCRPPLHPLAAPDSALPAFERILKLVQGSVQKREGRIVRQSPKAVVEQVFETLRDEGWLDHLRSGGSAEGHGRGSRRGGAARPGSPTASDGASPGGAGVEVGPDS